MAQPPAEPARGHPGPAPVAPWGDRLAAAVAARESQVVLGLDPDPRRLWPGTAGRGEAGGEPADRAAAAVAAHCRALIDAAGPACVAVKPQVACFERLGAPGWRALSELCGHARAAGLLVIADAKRGDVDVTAAAYGEAFFGGLQTPFGRIPGLGADCLTASPLLGADSLAPLLGAARAVGGGLLLLVRTSNPGARDVQEREVREGGTVSDLLAAQVCGLGAGSAGRHGLEDVGAVVGATAPEAVEHLRAAMPRAVLLLPGVGAQGGLAERLGPAFAPGPAGGLVPVSRSIARAHERTGEPPATAARAEAERLRALLWGLA